MKLKELLKKCRDYLKYREFEEKEGNISREVIDNYKTMNYSNPKLIKKLTVRLGYRKED